MEIRKITKNKKAYLPLLLLGDEQEDMIDRYLARGEMYLLTDGGAKAVCVVTDEGGGLLELKNIAVTPYAQRQGYGRQLLDFIEKTYCNNFSVLQAGTGDSPQTTLFYEACGFVRSHVIEHFFTMHYDHPIFEGGKQLTDMVYFQKKLSKRTGLQLPENFSIIKGK